MKELVKPINGKAEKKPKLTRAKRQEYLFVASLLVIPIICFLVFWVYVNVDSLFLAFQQRRYGTDGSYLIFTLDNFERVFTGIFSSGELLIPLRNTLLFFVLSIVIVLPLSILMSYFIYEKIWGYKVFRVVTYLPTIITGSALVVLFQYTFTSGSPYDAILRALGIPYENPLVTDYAIVLLLIYNFLFGFGPNLVILGGAMNAMSVDVLEAGEIDGCNWFQELIYLVLPMIWPTVSTIIMLSCAAVFSSTGPIMAMTGGAYNTSTLAFLLYAYGTGAVGTIQQDIYFASALGLVLTLITFPLVVLLRKVIFRERD